MKTGGHLFKVTTCFYPIRLMTNSDGDAEDKVRMWQFSNYLTIRVK